MPYVFDSALSGVEALWGDALSSATGGVAAVGFVASHSEVVEEGGSLSLTITGGATVMSGRDSSAALGFVGSATVAGLGVSAQSSAIFGLWTSAAVAVPGGGASVSSGALLGFLSASMQSTLGVDVATRAHFGVWVAATVAAGTGAIALPAQGAGSGRSRRSGRKRTDTGYRARVVTPPSGGAVTLTEAKKQLRLQHDADDDLVQQIIMAATAKAEEATRRALITQTIELTLDDFPMECGEAMPILLPGAPLREVASLTYIDATGVTRLVAAADLVQDAASEPGWLMPVFDKTWPATADRANAVRVRYIAGYGAADAVPAPIKQWVLYQIGAMYEHREAVIVGTINSGLHAPFIDGLLDPYRCDLVVV